MNNRIDAFGAELQNSLKGDATWALQKLDTSGSAEHTRPFSVAYQAFAPAVVSQQYMTNGAALGSTVEYAIESADVVLDVTSVLQGPPICDPSSTCSVSGVTTALQAPVDMRWSSSDGFSSTGPSFQFTVSSTSVGGRAVCEFAPQLISFFGQITVGTAQTGAQIMVRGSISGTAVFVYAGLSSAPHTIWNLSSQQGLLVGSLSAVLLSNPSSFAAAPAEGGLTFSSPFFLGFSFRPGETAVTVSTAGYGHVTSDALANVNSNWKDNTFSTINVSRFGLTPTVTDAVNDHSAYYVNGVACRCIDNITASFNGHQILRDGGLGHVDLFVHSRLATNRAEWDTRAHGNWGSIDQLKCNAHGSSSKASAAIERSCEFHYRLPFLRNIITAVAPHAPLVLTIRYAALPALVRSGSSTAAADGTAQQNMALIACRSANHKHTTTMIGSGSASTVHVGLLVTVATLSQMERSQYVREPVIQRLHTLQPVGRVLISAAATLYARATVQLAAVGVSSCIAAAIQPPCALASTTCGVGDCFSFVVSTTGGSSAAATFATGQRRPHQSNNLERSALLSMSMRLAGNRNRFYDVDLGTSQQLAERFMGIDAEDALSACGVLVFPLVASESASETSHDVQRGLLDKRSMQHSWLTVTAESNAAQIANATAIVWADDIRHLDLGVPPPKTA